MALTTISSIAASMAMLIVASDAATEEENTTQAIASRHVAGRLEEEVRLAKHAVEESRPLNDRLLKDLNTFFDGVYSGKEETDHAKSNMAAAKAFIDAHHEKRKLFEDYGRSLQSDPRVNDISSRVIKAILSCWLGRCNVKPLGSTDHDRKHWKIAGVQLADPALRNVFGSSADQGKFESHLREPCPAVFEFAKTALQYLMVGGIESSGVEKAYTDATSGVSKAGADAVSKHACECSIAAVKHLLMRHKKMLSRAQSLPRVLQADKGKALQSFLVNALLVSVAHSSPKDIDALYDKVSRVLNCVQAEELGNPLQTPTFNDAPAPLSSPVRSLPAAGTTATVWIHVASIREEKGPPGSARPEHQTPNPQLIEQNLKNALSAPLDNWPSRPWDAYVSRVEVMVYPTEGGTLSAKTFLDSRELAPWTLEFMSLVRQTVMSALNETPDTHVIFTGEGFGGYIVDKVVCELQSELKKTSILVRQRLHTETYGAFRTHTTDDMRDSQVMAVQDHVALDLANNKKRKQESTELLNALDGGIQSIRPEHFHRLFEYPANSRHLWFFAKPVDNSAALARCVSQYYCRHLIDFVISNCRSEHCSHRRATTTLSTIQRGAAKP